MAGQKVAIDIKTTADVSGVKTAEQAFEDLQVEVKPLQAEVLRISEALQDANNNNLEKVPKHADAAGESMDKMGRFATQAGFQITDFAVQVQGGQSAITAFSQQFPQLLGAIEQSGLNLQTLGSEILSMSVGIGTAISMGAVAAGVGISLLAAEYDKLQVEMKAADDSLKRLLASEGEMLKFRQTLARAFAEQFFERQLKAENELIVSQIESLRQRDRLLASKDAAAAASASADAAETGTPQSGPAGIEAAASAKVAALDRQVATEQEIWATLHQAYEDARQAAADAEVMATAEKISWETAEKKIAAAATTAKATLDQAIKLDELQRTAEDQKQIIFAGAREELAALGTATEAEITRQAQELQKQVAAMAPAAFSPARAGLDELGRILADGEVKGATEIAALRSAMIRIQTSQQGRDSEVMSTLATLESLNRTVVSDLRPMKSRLRALEESLNRLDARQR